MKRTFATVASWGSSPVKAALSIAFAMGDRVGVPWLGWTCGVCNYCPSDPENLCDRARFTAYPTGRGLCSIRPGRPTVLLHDSLALHGRRSGSASLRGPDWIPGAAHGGRGKAGRTLRLRAAAHIIAHFAVHQGRKVYAFTRPGDLRSQQFARELGAVWAGGSSTDSPVSLDAALIFAPIGALVPAAVRAVAKGGSVIFAGIHMSDIPSFPHAALWEERVIRSVANLTRHDADEFLALAPQVRVKTRTQAYPLVKANEALDDLRNGRLKGAAVLVPATSSGPEESTPDRSSLLLDRARAVREST
jgi:propanol-preferring alcohol dehydrogenase